MKGSLRVGASILAEIVGVFKRKVEENLVKLKKRD